MIVIGLIYLIFYDFISAIITEPLHEIIKSIDNNETHAERLSKSKDIAPSLHRNLAKAHARMAIVRELGDFDSFFDNVADNMILPAIAGNRHWRSDMKINMSIQKSSLDINFRELNDDTSYFIWACSDDQKLELPIIFRKNCFRNS